MEGKRLGPGVGLILLAWSLAASASQIEYTSAAAFDAAASNLTDYNFEGIAPAYSALVGDVTVGGVTFTAGGGSDYVIDANGGHYGASFFSGQRWLDPLSQVVCTLAGTNELGFTYGDSLDSSTPFTVTLDSGASFTLTTPFDSGSDTGFVGFISSTPITSVTFSNQGDAFDIIGFQAGPSVPEPGPLVLMATGLLGMAVGRRRLALAVKTRR
jgi:hypothetical protein